jgi:glc operon protein GlcG
MSSPLLIAKHTLSIGAAKEIAAAAVKSASASGLNVVIAIVDDGGNLLYLERMDGAAAGCVDVAHRKARASTAFKTETKNFQTGLEGGTLALLSLDLVPFGGGVPVLSDTGIAGAIGVSGGSADQDAVIAAAGVAALSLKA